MSVQTSFSPKISIETLSTHMIHVEGGPFMMGGDGLRREKPIHEVRVSSFSLCRYPVTQQLWEEVMGTNPSIYKDPLRPAEMVDWYQAVAFCNLLSRREELEEVYEVDESKRDSYGGALVKIIPERNGYRLPTEAEWEYAARGGVYHSPYAYAGSEEIEQVAWYEGNSVNHMNRLRLKRPNALGLFDMSGNVYEWCWDLFDSAYYGDCQKLGVVENPKGPNKGSRRVVRGGSWIFNNNFSRVAVRYYFNPSFRFYNFGFRVSRYLPLDPF